MILTNHAALLQLARSLLIEQNEWLVSRRYLSQDPTAELPSTNPNDRKGAPDRVGRIDGAEL